ncbi:MAG: amino acid adenylation domain-containing protein [Nitrospirae bacterium]|nr:MAG: amino acid adenylation domain-containing protein [Nitrospirota bacterium]
MAIRWTTLIDVLRHRASLQTDRRLYTFLLDGEIESGHLTFGELDQRARTIGGYLQQQAKSGERALLLYPAGFDFIAAFWGCLYAGIIAIAVPLVRSAKLTSRLQALITDASPRFLLTTESWLARERAQLDTLVQTANVAVVPTSTLSKEWADSWSRPSVGGRSLAYLQYTSGSTANPKGVMMTHECVLHNLAAIGQTVGYTSESVSVTWLPHFHDMGLVNGLLQPLFHGCWGIVMPPFAFVQRPIRWLQAISRYRGTHSGGPNFAYDLCVRKISQDERATLDLTSWQVAYNGAEPVRQDTLVQFAETFKSQGFRQEAFCPAYGLAEATLMVTSKRPGQPLLVQCPPAVRTSQADRVSECLAEDTSRLSPSRPVVGCGRPDHGITVKIVHPERHVLCASGEVGEIWVAGPSVARGYWNREQETRETFHANLADTGEGPFLRTGDLGFLQDGELFVTGRLKDLIIVRGINYYSHEIEQTVDRCHPALRPGGVACSMEMGETREVGAEEQLMVIQEVDRHVGGREAEDIFQAIRQAVAREHGLHVAAVVLVRPGAIPRTSSGKVRRRACKEAYRARQLPVIAENVREAVHFSEAESLTRDEWLLLSQETCDRVSAIEQYLRRTLAAKLGLEIQQIVAHDRLYALGVDSLRMFELRQAIERTWGVTVPFSRLLDGPSLSELAQDIDRLMHQATSRVPLSLPEPSIPRENDSSPSSSSSMMAERAEEPVYPLSYGQQGLWVLQQESPESDAYHLRFAARVDGPLHLSALQRAWRRLVARHPCLRTTFYEREGQLHQKVRELDEQVFEVIDATAWAPEIFMQALDREAYRPFDLERGPLFRLVVFARAPREWILLLTVHHLLMDLWSMSIVIDELRRMYAAEIAHDSCELPPLSTTYFDFVRWQAECLAGPEGDRLWQYWRRQLQGDLPVLRLPTDRPRLPGRRRTGGTWTFSVSSSLTARLRRLAQQQGTTVYVVLLTALEVLLSRYTHQTDFIIGSPAAGRTRPGCEDVVGYFVNVLPVRADVSGNPTVTALLARTHRIVAQALDHQDYPFPLLVERLGIERDPSVPPVFQVMFVYERPHRLEDEGLSAFILGDETVRMRFGNLELSPLSFPPRSTQVDLTLFVVESGAHLQASFHYHAELFDRDRIERMATHFVTVLEGLVSNPDAEVSVLPLLPAWEQECVLAAWNRTETVYPRDLGIHQVFESQAAQTPDAVAVIAREMSLTYRELDQRANHVARYLCELGVHKGTCVGLCMDRAIEMIVGLLGILKAGAAYVPLDPTYPDERLHFMMDDTRMRVVLTQARFRERFRDRRVHVVCLDSEWRTIAQPKGAFSSCSVTGEALAYVMYTSGSTGRPKGVCIPHRGVVRLVKGQDYVDFHAPQVFLHLAPLAFDASTFEIWGPLLNGATLVIAPPGPFSLEELGRVVREYGITTLWLTADVFHRMVEAHLDALAPIQQLIAGGDVLSVPHVNRMHEAFPECRLINGYGPTENTTFTCCYPITSTIPLESSVPIGRPLANTQVYILDAHRQPVPIGVVGELYVGGDGLAQGYLNQPELTAQRFIPSPLTPHRHGDADRPSTRRSSTRQSSTRLYRTGDLACYRPDGTLEFHGRVDRQVKVRGYRVELEEIEAAIRQYPAVQDVAVVLQEMPGKRSAEQLAEARPEKGLVAYVILREAVPNIHRALRSFLKAKVPSHLLPAHIRILDTLPRLAHGKVDYHALAARESVCREEYEIFRLPRDPIEESLAEIWREVLGVKDIGIDENFFELGGHSLLVTQVLSRVQHVFHVDLPVRCLFEQATLAEFAACVREALKGKDHGSPVPPEPSSQGVIVPLSKAQPFPLSFSQERMWFLNQLEGGGTAYTMPLAVRLRGPIQIESLVAAINEIWRRHEVLRTTVEVNEGRPVPVVHPPNHVDVPLVDLHAIPEMDRMRAFERHARRDIEQPFDLARGPLFRATVFRLHETEHILLVLMHHLVSDAWSWSVFFHELETLYAAFVQKRPSPLADLSIQYRDFAYWQRHWFRGEVLNTQLAYWKRQLANAPFVLDLPTDRPRLARQTFHGATEWVELPAHLMEQVTALSQRAGVTLFMLMLAAFNVLLYRYTRQADLLVGVPIANRRWLETEQLIGTFVNTLVLRTDLSGSPSFRTLLGRVKAATLDAYAHQDLPFEQLVEALRPPRDLSRSPLFQVMFSMPNVPMPALRWTDLDVEVVPLDRGGAQFDLTATIADMPKRGYVASFEYNTDLFTGATIRRMLQQYQRLLEAAVASPDHSIETLPLMAESERHHVLVEWNRTEQHFSHGQCLHHAFERQVEKTPDAVAIISGEERVSYRQLNQRANQVAHYLRNAGVSSEALVGILLDRSVNLVVALLGVLKAGGAYVPLDPSYPAERVRFMLEDAQVSVLLTQETFIQSIPPVPVKANGSSRSFGGPLVINMTQETFVTEPTDDLQAAVQPTNLAYVIYTSGSTGQPKGVMITHRSLVNFMEAMQKEPGLSPNDVLLAVTSLSFDIAALELFLPLLVGARVVLASREIAADGMQLRKLLLDSGATVMQGTPATWRLLLDAGWKGNKGFRALCGGEALPRSLANRLLEHGVELWNLYGPTETTIWSAVHRVHPDEGPVPIGRPIANTRFYVLDGHGQPVPIGVPGELYIGGEGLARGYLRRPDLTDQKFVSDPFHTGPLARLYRTGDLVKYRPDGTLEFLGRLDHQVKLRGFRIELGEIEAVLNQHPAVDHSVVTVVECDGVDEPGPAPAFRDPTDRKSLVAYVVPTNRSLVQVRRPAGVMLDRVQQIPFAETAALRAELREFLRQRLPDYMIPSGFVFVKAFPLTPNGKIDRQRLPRPIREPAPSAAKVAPRTMLEQQLLGIWIQVLGTPDIGVYDDFFELGGHSLLATQVLARVYADLGVELSLATLFEYPTIAELAQFLSSFRVEASTPQPAQTSFPSSNK